MPPRALAVALMAALAAGCVPAMQAPQWSPDSKRVAFIHRATSAAGALYVVDLSEEGSSPERLPAGEAMAVSAFAWSSDGTQVYYAEADENGSRLRRCLPDGSADIEITEFRGEQVRWLASSADGLEVFALVVEPEAHPGEIVAVDVAAGAVGSVEGAAKRCFAPLLLGPDGRDLLYVTGHEVVGAGGDRRPEAVIWRLPVKGGAAAEVARAGGVALDAPGALAATPDGKQIVFCGSGDAGLLVLDASGKVRKKVALPKPIAPYFVTVSRDGAEVFVGALFGEDLKTARSLRVDLAAGRSTMLESGKVLLGGRVHAPDGRLYAEHTASGLRVAEAKGRWEIHYPVTMRQSLLAARENLKAGRKDEALADLAYGVNSPHHDAPKWELLYEKCGLHLGKGEDGPATESFLEAYLPHPEYAAPPRAEVMRLMRRVEPLGDRIVKPLRQAEEALDEQDLAYADEKLRSAYKMVYKPARLGGILYRRALVAARRGEPRAAASLYCRASDCDGFPQRGIATLRAALIFIRRGKLDVASERIMKTLDSDPDSPYAAALTEALGRVSSVKPPLRRIAEEVAVEEGLRFWVERCAEFDLRFSPATLDEPDGDLELVLAWTWGVSTETARGTRALILKGLRAEVGAAVASPDGSMLAFGARAAGEGGRGWSAVYAVDRAGRPLLGRLGELTGGALPADRSVKSFSWDGEGRAVISVLHEKDENGEPRTLRLPVRGG